MTDQNSHDQALKALSGEIRHVQHHLASLHQQGAVMLRMMSAMMNKLKELTIKEEGLEHGIDAIENEIARMTSSLAAAGSCPACGGPLDHHQAASGELQICRACGFSRFVDGHGVVRTTAQPAAPPVADEGIAPPSWVG